MIHWSYKSPFAVLYCQSDQFGLRSIEFKPRQECLNEACDAMKYKIQRSLNAYFNKKPFLLDFDLYIPEKGFSSEVLKYCMEIPFGETMTYGELARKAGNPNASRAVGRIMSSNRVPIFIPCHRVIGSQGHLTGYRGGLELKIALLKHEGAKIIQKRKSRILHLQGLQG